MRWRTEVCILSALLLCTGVLVTATVAEPVETARSTAEARAQAAAVPHEGIAAKQASGLVKTARIIDVDRPKVEESGAASQLAWEKTVPGALSMDRALEASQIEAKIKADQFEGPSGVAGMGRASGDDCTDPMVIGPLSLAGLPYQDLGQTNCGRLDTYDDASTAHCLYYYDSGEEIIYSLTVSEAMTVTITMDPGATTYAGIAIGDACPPTDSCIAADYSSAAAAKVLANVSLAPGTTYYIMVDTWSSPDCIPSFDLTIDADPCDGVVVTDDNCGDPTPVALSEGVPAVFTGDNTCASVQGPCFTESDGETWMAFTLSSNGIGWDVTLDMCATTNGWGNAWLNLADECPCDTVTDAAAFETTSCANGNVTMTWSGLAAGTYYYPVVRDPANGAEGEYEISVVATTYVPTYCSDSYPTSTSDSLCSGVTLDTMVNSSGTACIDYSDFTALPATDLARGASYAVSVTGDTCGGCYGKWAKVFIDWNQDKDFDDANEQAYTSGTSSSSCPQTFAGSVTVPLTALLGNTRMRVVVREGGTESSTLPCGTYSWGETEDYTVNVILPPPTGACCLGYACTNGNVTADYCVNTLGGVYQGDGTDCDPNPCIGACCFPDGSCDDAGDEAYCAGLSGIFSGYGTDCDPNDCEQPGQFCGNPIVINIPAELDYFDSNGTSCDFVDDDEDTCLGSYDGGEDVIYELNVTADTCVRITMDEHSSYSYLGMAVDSECPLSDTCLASATSGNPDIISELVLATGTYYMMIDTWASPECADFDLEIIECPEGACCNTSGLCSVGLQSECLANGGEYVGDDTDCDPDPCAQGACCTDTGCEELDTTDCAAAGGDYLGDGTICSPNPCPPLNDICTNATDILAVPFSDALDNSMAEGDGPPGLCDFSTGLTVMAKDVWWSYTPTTECLLSLDVDPDAGAGYDGIMMIYSGPDCNDLTPLDIVGAEPTGCYDDPEPYHSEFVASNGVTYWFQVGDYGTLPGTGGLTTFDLSCVSAPGACCFDDGTCTEMTPFDCVAGGGTFDGEGTICTPNPCPQPVEGDNCALPIAITLPAELEYAETNGYTCGRGNDYEDTCMGYYDSGEDALYELTVTEAICVDITVTSATTYVGIGLDNVCPLGDPCIATFGDSSTGAALLGQVLTAGTYYLMVDTWASPDCIPTYTLEITASAACAQGACCLDTPECVETFEAACTSLGGAFAGDGTVCGGDCDSNGVTDICAILDGALDCQPNDIPDTCDIDGGGSADINSNDVPDECDPDCNENGVPDDVDIAQGTSEDCQPDGVPDECQIGAGKDILISESFEDAYPPTDWTTQIQNASYTWKQAAALSPIHGANIVDCEYDATLTPQDEWVLTPALNMTGTVTLSGYTMGSAYWGVTPYDNYDVEAWIVVGATAGDGDDTLIAQLDEDYWTVNWQWETFNYNFAAPSGTFRIGFRYVGADGAQAGLDYIVVDGTGGGGGEGDCNGNSVPDDCDVAGGTSADCNGNIIPDECETDCNSNGYPDDCDVTAGSSLDCNGDQVPDECQLEGNDCNSDLIPDDCQLALNDCNANEVPDDCDIAGGTSEDCQPDGVPDECQLSASKAIVVSESFEDAYPPTDWITQIQNAAYTWKQAAALSPIHGANIVDCEYDATLTAQDEWVLTPALNMSGSVALNGYTMGSAYWGVTPYDNYDVEAWIVVGATAGDGDDTLIGQLDEDYWTVNWQWETFNYNFTAPAGEFRVGFRYVGADGAQAGLDFITIDGESGAPANDCNQNGVPDECDIAGATSTDYNNNNVPDDCEICGDLDGDEDVDIDDYWEFVDAYGTCLGDPKYNPAADLVPDDCIGLNDYQAWTLCYRMANGKAFSVGTGGGGGTKEPPDSHVGSGEAETSELPSDTRPSRNPSIQR
ncbi:MAG: hypothetical protein GY842_12210 [bacterium]|nr:hypothetical protein [bacterium]